MAKAEPSPGPNGERVAAALIVGAGLALLLSGVLFALLPDEEDYRHAILSALLQARALARGTWAFWTSDLGFGMPLPLGQHLQFHPLVPLLNVLSLTAWTRLFLTVHVLILAAGGWVLARQFTANLVTAATVTTTLLLSAATTNPLLVDFWPSVVYGWSLAPWLLAALVWLLRSEGSAWVPAIALGFVAGLLVGNGHIGYVAVFPIPMLAFLVAEWRLAWRRRRELLLALGVALIIAAPSLVPLLDEWGRFPPGLNRKSYLKALSVAQLWDLLLRPIPLRQPWDVDLLARGVRIAFFGPWAWLALWACLHPRTSRGLRAGCIVSLFLLMSPTLERVEVHSATYLLRDPLSLFGALMAAGVVDRLRDRWPRTAAAVICVQVLALSIATWPFVARTFEIQPRETPAWTFSEEGPVVQGLRTHVGPQARLAYTSRFYRKVFVGAFSDGGLWRNALGYHHLRLVNGLFKGVATDPVSPSESVFYGEVVLPVPTQQSSESLSMLGVHYLLCETDEPVAPNLVPVAHWTVAGQTVVLYRVPDATGATVLPLGSRLSALTDVETCGQWALCGDFSPLWRARAPGVATLNSEDGRITVAIPSTAAPRTVLIAEMFRPEWRATEPSGARVWDNLGLIAVDVPTGTTSVTLTYRPLWRVVTLTASVVLMLFCAALLGRTAWQSRRGRVAAPPPGAGA